jgi:hypothetical protein
VAAGIPVKGGRFQQASSYVAIESPTIYAELTGDGHDDAVVTITCSTGVSSGTRAHPWVYAADPTAPGGVRRLPFTALTAADLDRAGLAGSSFRGATATVSGGVLNLAWPVTLPGQPLSSAAKLVTTHQRWAGAAWQEAAPATVEDYDPNR